MPTEHHPDFLKKSRSTVWIQWGATALKKLAPAEFLSNPTFEENLKSAEPPTEDTEQTVPFLSTLSPQLPLRAPTQKRYSVK